MSAWRIREAAEFPSAAFHSIFFLILKLAYGYQAANIVKEEQRAFGFIREMIDRMDFDLEDPGEFTASVLREISLIKGELMDLDHYYPKSCRRKCLRLSIKGKVL